MKTASLAVGALLGALSFAGCGDPMMSGGDTGAGRDATGGGDTITPPGDSGGGGGDGGGDAIAPMPDGGGGDVVTPPGDAGMIGECPAPPAGSSDQAIAAYMRLNGTRAAMGSPCATMVATANLGARHHCDYYVSNRSISMCVANPHVEVSSCMMYTGMSFADRMRAAGYTGSPAFEVMHFLSPESGAGAVQGWIDSVWHRTPVLSPWVRDFGYGGVAGCETIDFGRGNNLPPATLVRTYPYDGQTGVPTQFLGNEGPAPPAPPTGWPSGYPITVYLQGTIATHVLTRDGDTTPIDHVWIAPGTAQAMGLLRNEFFLYAYRPLTAATRYRVQVTGMNSAGAVNLSWTFTTR